MAPGSKLKARLRRGGRGLILAAGAWKPVSSAPRLRDRRADSALLRPSLEATDSGSVGSMMGCKVPVLGLCLTPLALLPTAQPDGSPSRLSSLRFTFWTDTTLSPWFVSVLGALRSHSGVLGQSRVQAKDKPLALSAFLLLIALLPKSPIGPPQAAEPFKTPFSVNPRAPTAPLPEHALVVGNRCFSDDKTHRTDRVRL